LRALIEHRTVPIETKSFERLEDEAVRSWYGAGRVDVLHADEPGSVVSAGVEVAGHGGYERAEVEGAGR